MVNEPMLSIEEYITDEEAEFNWRYDSTYGLSMKLRLNASDESKYRSKFALEFENTAGYEMQALPMTWRRRKDGTTEILPASVPPPTERMLLFFEGEHEKEDFVQGILRLALFFKLHGYKFTETQDPQNDQE